MTDKILKTRKVLDELDKKLARRIETERQKKEAVTLNKLFHRKGTK